MINAARTAPAEGGIVTKEHLHADHTTAGSHPPEPNPDRNDRPLYGPVTRPVEDDEANSSYDNSHPLDPHSHVHVHHSYQAARDMNRRAAEQHVAVTSDADEEAVADYLFLRSAPRRRERHTSDVVIVASVPEELQVELTGAVMEAVDSMGSMSTINFARTVPGHHPHPIVVAPTPFIVHVKSPVTPQSRAQLEHALSHSLTGYFVDRYLPVSNYLLVPQSESAANRTKLFRALTKLKPMVRAWHVYEKQDKIDPFLCQSKVRSSDFWGIVVAARFPADADP